MIVAGFGFSGRASASSLHDALRRTGVGGPIDAIATLAVKAEAPAWAAFAATVQTAPALLVQEVRHVMTPTQSARSLDAYATGSVAEATALVAAGPGSKLVYTRVLSDDGFATCAIAERKEP